MRDVILHLGGNSRRIERTATEAKWNPGALVLISSEGDKPQILDYLGTRGIHADRILIDDTAYDTVGNITDTFSIVKREGAKRVFIVTDDWHMRRAMAIAMVAYAFRGITPIACPYHSGVFAKDPGNVPWDVFRTLKWRIDGKPTERNYRH